MLKLVCTFLSVRLLLIITILTMLSMFGIGHYANTVALLGLFLTLVSYPIMGKGFKNLVAIFVLLGAGLNLYTDQPLSTWVAGVNYMMNITVILVVTQLFVLPIRLGNYEEHLRLLILTHFPNERRLYLFVMGIVHMFASFLLFGTIPVMVSLIGAPLKKIVKDYRYFMATVLSRGYATVCIWAPGAVNILIVVTATGSSWTEVFLMGFVLSMLGLGLNLLFMRRHLSEAALPAPEGDEVDPLRIKAAMSRVWSIALVTVLLIALIFTLGHFHIGSNTGRVMLACLIIAIGWLSAYHKHPDIGKITQWYLHDNLVKTIDLAVMYVALGIFSKSLDISGVLTVFNPAIAWLAQTTGIFVLPIIALSLSLLSFLGIHPFVLLVLYGSTLSVMETGLDVRVLSMTLAFGAMVSYMLSPFAGIVLTSAKFLGATVHEVGLKWNGAFCATYFTLGCVILMCWQLCLGLRVEG